MLEFNFDKELELLLRCRSLWLRDAEPSAGDDATGSAASPAQASEHLDADKLNAFVYGALPRAGQSRDREHLADCDSCCALLSELSRALDTSITPAPHTPDAALSTPTPRPHRLTARESLSRFFAWPSLRFAAPAFALLLGGLCVYVYVFKKPEENLVTVRLDDRGGGASPIGTRDEAGPGAVHTEGPRRSITSASPTPEPRKQEPASGTRGGPATIASDKTAVSDKTAPTSDPSPPDIRKRGGVTVPPPENNESPGDVGRGLSRDMTATRSGLSYAAGHQFRREGATWVDVNYNKSMALIRLRRGSDAYLSTAVDQPALRAVAEQLSGEVIVVLGNRAYSIR